MTKATQSPVRASAALALAVYGWVLLAGPALLHHIACSHDPTPHCVVCAFVCTVSSQAEPLVRPAADRADAGRIVASPDVRDGVVPRVPAGQRAPPAASCPSPA